MTTDKRAIALPLGTRREPRAGYLMQALATPSRLHAALMRRLHAAAERAASRVTRADRTTGKHELSELTIASANAAAGVHFVSTPWAVLRWVHDCLPPESQKRRTTFVDLGAGIGRAVLSAASRPYKRVIGVEFAAELAAEARANVRDLGHDPWRVTVVEGDAAEFAFPNGPLIVFLFNPFGPSVLVRVLDNLAARVAEGRGDVIVAYLNPVHRDILDHHPAFAAVPLDWRKRTLFRTLSPYRLALYEAKGPASVTPDHADVTIVTAAR